MRNLYAQYPRYSTCGICNVIKLHGPNLVVIKKVLSTRMLPFRECKPFNANSLFSLNTRKIFTIFFTRNSDKRDKYFNVINNGL